MLLRSFILNNACTMTSVLSKTQLSIFNLHLLLLGPVVEETLLC